MSFEDLALPHLAGFVDMTVAWRGKPFAGAAGQRRAINRRFGPAIRRMRLFSVDELCPPAPPDGYFWRQVRREFLAWADVAPVRCHPFRVDAPDLSRMCEEYEATIADAGGLDLIMLGLGPNAHIASNEPGTPFSARTRLVRLLRATVDYILTDEVIQGEVCDQAVTLGMTTILAAREVVLLVSGAPKRDALRRVLEGPAGPDVPASIVRLHANALILADRDAAG